MRQIKQNIPSTALNIIANKLVSKYPKMFRAVDDDGIVLGNAACAIFTKLHERAII